MPRRISTGSQRCLGMSDEFRLACCSGGREQHRGCVDIRQGSNRPDFAFLEQFRQRLHPAIIDRVADNETCIRWDDRGIYRGDASVEIRLADVEGRLQPLQQRPELRGFQSGVQGCRDRSDAKAGVIGHNQLSQVRHMQRDPIPFAKAALRQSARETLDISRQPFVRPDVCADTEGDAVWTRFRVMVQNVYECHGHLSYWDLVSGGSLR